MKDRLAGKAAIITGGASGIGRASAERMIAEGARVVLADIRDKVGRDAADAMPAGAATFLHCDVTDEKSVRGMVEDAASWLGGLDILFNSAGMLSCGPLTDLDVETWDRVFAVNVRGAFLACRAAIPHMRARGSGSIINASSLAGLRGMPGLTLYSSTKAAMIGLSTTLALELAPDRIRVNALCPGWIDTPFNQPVIDAIGGPQAQAQAIKAGIPLGRMGEVAEVAAMVAYLASDEASFITAQALSINGGAYN
jgi:NAD(P)-dependent dehydrogenase (short-subunit alcohol dehydrogenase family)